MYNMRIIAFINRRHGARRNQSWGRGGISEAKMKAFYYHGKIIDVKWRGLFARMR